MYSQQGRSNRLSYIDAGTPTYDAIKRSFRNVPVRGYSERSYPSEKEGQTRYNERHSDIPANNSRYGQRSRRALPRQNQSENIYPPRASRDNIYLYRPNYGELSNWSSRKQKENRGPDIEVK